MSVSKKQVACRFLLSVLLILGLASGCAAPPFIWSSHITFRSGGQGLLPSHLEPNEIKARRIDKLVHHMSIELEALFIRDLAGAKDNPVALGVEITGVRGNEIPLMAVPAAGRGTGEGDALFFKRVLTVRPFLYRGHAITITFWFKSLTGDQMAQFNSQVAAAGPLLWNLDPNQPGSLLIASRLFDNMICPDKSPRPKWKYSFSLYPSGGVLHDKPENLLVAGRRILMLLPPADISGRYRRFNPRRLQARLMVKSGRLVYRKTGLAYRASPYIILRIRRYDSLPAASHRALTAKGKNARHSAPLMKGKKDSTLDR